MIGLAMSTLPVTLLASQAPQLSWDDGSQTSISIDPLVSTRALALAGAIAPLAEGIDAAFFNPANIGLAAGASQSFSDVHLLHLPYVGLSGNSRAVTTYRRMRKEGGTSSKKAADAVFRDSAGMRHFARVSSSVALALGRALVLQSSDLQFKGTPLSDARGRDHNMRGVYQERHGLGAGFSLSDPSERWRLGLYTSYSKRRIFNGRFSFLEVGNISDRRKFLASNGSTYTGLAANLGLCWQAPKGLRPAVALVVRDLGDTVFRGEAQDDAVRTVHLPESYRRTQASELSIAISPKIGARHVWHLVFALSSLEDRQLIFAKRLSLGLELVLSGSNKGSLLSLRSGVSAAGMALGLGLNLGLLKFELAARKLDVGNANHRVLETRYAAVLAINLSDHL